MSFIKQANFITAGFVGTPYLLDALTEIGRLDKAYTLLLREEYPSWLYFGQPRCNNDLGALGRFERGRIRKI